MSGNNFEIPMEIPAPETQFVKFLQRVKSFNKRFNIVQVELSFQLRCPTTNTCTDWLNKAFNEVIETIQKEGDQGDKVILEIFLEENSLNKPIFLGLRPLASLSADAVFSALEKVYQSTIVFNIADVLGVKAYLLPQMEGRGRHHNPTRMNLSEMRKYKQKSIVDISGPSNCLPTSIVVGKCLLINNNEERKKQLDRLKRYPTVLKKEVLQLIKNVGGPVSEEGSYGLDFVNRFDKKFGNQFRINIYDDAGNFESIAYKSRRTQENHKKVINLFYNKAERHYFCIKSVKGFFGFNYQCDICDSLYNRSHICPETCKYCTNTPPCPSVRDMIPCIACNRSFRGTNCLQHHIDKGVCNTRKLCDQCFTMFDPKTPHDCNSRTCDICFKVCPLPHFCYMQEFKKKPSTEYTLIFYDFESEFVDIGNGFSKHVPNLCISYTVCHMCGHSLDSNCPNCAPVEHVFESDSNRSAVEKFVDYVLTFRPMPTVAIAHNAKGYDAQFILEELCQREEKIEPILQGCKILYAKVKGVTFLDSLSFIPFPLSQFSKSFGLPECDKGYYPYKFNITGNRSYIGPYPPIDMYPIESMSSQQYAEFLEWYEQVKELPFDNRKELIHYCRQDVKILMKGCLNFMFSFIETTGLNPFLQAITIADAVMKAYRKKYLIPNTLAITPKNNYNSNFLQMQSKISLKWLVHMKETSNPNIKYEVKLRGSRYIADGYDEASNTVYSFEGCFFHGHTCFLNRGHAFSKRPNDNMQSRYEATLKRLDHIRQLGYNLVSIWECEFRRMLESDPVLAERLNNHPEVVDSGFDLRSAVYGGRTEVFRTYYKCRPGDKIYYYDFTSLYPWANKYSKYFVGHPKIIKDIPSQEEVLRHDGVVKCTILPPKGLYIPCLPFRCNNRLFFPLCRKCAEELNTDRCLHSDDERSLTGIWSIDEVRLAVDHGYVITKCFEVWSYRTSQYNRETGERGLFADYVDNFLKIKQEASGWPSGVESESDKDNYISEFFENEGIQLDKDNIRVNKGMRSLAKIMLNSLWGRFIMRENFTKTTICNSPEELNALLSSEAIKIVQFYPASDNQFIVSWKHIHDSEPPSKYVNMGVGICTTTNARIKLYSILSKIGHNIFYCDTDSVIYVVPAGEENPLSTGKFLGELTDELADFGEGAFIEEFVSTGPKVYGLKIYSPSTNSYSYKVVCKGISQNREVAKDINFDSLKSLVLCDDKEIKVTYPNKIQRQKHFKIVSGPSSKTTQFTFIKRRCIENNYTLPFGY
ncbi:uncharacterized protein LOC129808916 [Phlebotomus papatasi]|uniref:uncharacterized protein LOC129808916 n=1 Tax=Phlebotomus papatasi TaxID=29031 RepID=UPI002483E620|nr:uncharacterized protein LOC129808916 [Phlebotomus papatasi]